MANITYRHAIPTLADIPNSTTVKSEPLTLEEIDANFKSLDNAIAETVNVAGTIPTSIKNTSNVFTKNQSVAPVSPSIVSGSVSTNSSLSNNFRIVLTANVYINKPSNLTDGMILNFFFKQVGGPWTVTYHPSFLFPNGTPPVHSAKVDFMSCYYDATDDVLCCNLLKNYNV